MTNMRISLKHTSRRHQSVFQKKNKKTRTKYRVPWETLAVREKRSRENCLQKLSEEPKKHNCPKTRKGTIKLAGIYLKEQTEYIQNQVYKIRDSVEDRLANKKRSE